jgi:HSP20 family protein
MSLIKFKSNAPVFDPFEQFFNDFFEGEFLPKRPGMVRNGSLPAANIKETDGAYHIELAAPGMKKEDFKVEVQDDLLTIRSEKKEERSEQNERFTKREFNYTSFVRTFRLPEEVNVESISAEYQEGILRLDVPKKEVTPKAQVREISVK